MVIYLDAPPRVVAPGAGRHATIRQEGGSFVPPAVAIPAGDNVDFPNDDFVSHNVFSLTAGSGFDLGIYPRGQVKSVQFNQPSEVDVFCNIHQDMRAKILVVPTELFTRVGPDGRYRLRGVPPGRQVLVAWSNAHKPQRAEVEIKAGKTAHADFKLLARGGTSAHLNKEGEPYGR